MSSSHSSTTASDSAPPSTAMTPDAKAALSDTIRGLHKRLIRDLHDATDGAYRLSQKAEDVRLTEAARVKRARLESWIDEQVRALEPQARDDAAERFRLEVEKDAAATMLNRLVYLRLMEAAAPREDGTVLRREQVLTGGWESRGYRDFREFAPDLVRGDETEGYATLLQLIFDDLALDLPGLFGDVRLTALVPVPAATLRAAVEALDAPELASCWADDMTLGWIYQYWNDPEREALDDKLNDGGKVESHQIASKTQMFTERYMVDWLLQNSLGPMWLAMCKKHGWTPEAEADGTLARLETRRAEWRMKREAGEVSLTDHMPLNTDVERRWAYYLPQPIPDDAVAQASSSVRDLRILDPAVGSGHFLVVAFDLLVALYREEARHRGEEGEARWSDQAIVERVLEHNLNGIDLDPRAVQIAAAALWLKAQRACATARPRRLNLVASSLRLSSLPADDAARSGLYDDVERETGIPGTLTAQLLDALAGADHLGSLLKIDAAVDKAIAEAAGELDSLKPAQGDLLSGSQDGQKPMRMSADAAKAALLGKLEGFLRSHAHGDDLGLRLQGEQLAAGVRFLRMVREGAYDLVVANPPYQGTSKMADAGYVQKQYPLGKSDLYAAFLLRGLELVRPGGVSAMLTMRNWMFIKQYAGLRERLLQGFALRALGDFDRGAFEDVPDEVVSVAASAFGKHQGAAMSVALLPTPRGDKSRDGERTHRKRAATLCHVGRHEFAPAALKVVPEWPLVYWWRPEFVNSYANAGTLGSVAPGKQGVITGDNVRFVRHPWEVGFQCNLQSRNSRGPCAWQPYIQGASSHVWIEPLRALLRWEHLGLEIRTFERNGKQASRPQNLDACFRPGVAFSAIGDAFSARVHRFPSIFSDVGASLFPSDNEGVCAYMNSTVARSILESLNPTIHFTIGDVNRLPASVIPDASRIFNELGTCFEQHEAHRETSVEFNSAGPSGWRYAQRWAQTAVDRPEGTPLPQYIEELDPEPAADHLSFALGAALGRFGANGEGVLDPCKDDLSNTLPAGVCFLDGSLDAAPTGDSLGHYAAACLVTTWAEYRHAINADTDLRTYLRLKFFPNVHKGMYENRPIHLPLSSKGRTFVAYVSIHRWTDDTLRTLLADHLHPARIRLEGEIADLRDSRQSRDKKQAREAERRFATVDKWKAELDDFIAKVEQCAEKGPPPVDAATPGREVDARYSMDLNDGVMVNSAALWPLLEPQWKDPKKWWKELAVAKGKKDYDWSHLAARYFPGRVDAKCRQEPSLGVAHGCFWRYHPESAYKWELRLQDEIAPDFTIDEPGSDKARVRFEADYPRRVVELWADERKRRKRAQAKREHNYDWRAMVLAEHPDFEVSISMGELWHNRAPLVYELELRLQGDVATDLFLDLDEVAEEIRTRFEKTHTKEAVALLAAERERRKRHGTTS